MAFTLREALSDSDRQRACAMLQRVYVTDAYTSAERAAQFMIPERLAPEGAFLIAVQQHGEVIGAVLFLNEDSSLRQLAGPGEREFRMLGVDAAARGAGVGEALVQACIDRARAAGAAALVLWTQPTMLAAHRLYERLGFQRATERDVEDERGFTRLVYAYTY